ncbi:hypothetical protein J6590_076484 [Homalodisca vitripennis]|nr:hypothetical protein J6590_076484 [Homalodisca vitripennis]
MESCVCGGAGCPGPPGVEGTLTTSAYQTSARWGERRPLLGQSLGVVVENASQVLHRQNPGVRGRPRSSSPRDVIVLDDNFPGESHGYLVAVHTGARMSAGTSANVGIRLFGALYSSRVRSRIYDSGTINPL